jgi:ribonucleoside-diphosphate reductase alpha chain
LLMLHWEAWRTGIKSLYYCRSKSVRRAEFINAEVKLAEMPLSVPPTDYSECLACQ